MILFCQAKRKVFDNLLTLTLMLALRTSVLEPETTHLSRRKSVLEEGVICFLRILQFQEGFACTQLRFV